MVPQTTQLKVKVSYSERRFFVFTCYSNNYNCRLADELNYARQGYYSSGPLFNPIKVEISAI